MHQNPDIPTSEAVQNTPCTVCRNLLIHLERFMTLLKTAQNDPTKEEWLTVEEIADELKLSKSIVYRLIRNGELEAVNLVDTDGHIAQKGHYRIQRQCLNRYLERKQITPMPAAAHQPHRSRHLPKVKNHLGV